MKTVGFSETIEACDLKVGRCRQLIELMKVWKVKVISWKILFSRTGRLIFMKARPQDIRWAFTGPMVLWFHIPKIIIFYIVVAICDLVHDVEALFHFF